MKTKTGILLGLMMFLQYYIWGAWYVTMGTYMGEVLKSSGVAIGAAYGAGAIATIISPFFVGMIADRFFAAQKIMGVLHLMGAALLFYATKVNNENFYWVILIYSLMYMPTIALSNSVAFAQMTDPGKQFPWIRVFGTLGWIVAGLVIDKFIIQKELINGIETIVTSSLTNTFLIASLVSALLGLISFILPTTPPKSIGVKTTLGTIFGKDAFILFKEKSFIVFFIAAILICIPLSFYYGFANPFLIELGLKEATAKMTLGQMSEALFILAIPFMFYKIGVKNMLIIGILGWALRYICFAYGTLDASWLLYAGIILHGICYDFFFVTGYMYTEKKAGAAIKNAAQGLFTFATYGVGMFIGTKYSGYVVDKYKITAAVDGITKHHWEQIWLIPAAIAGAVLIVFVLFFKEKKEAIIAL